VQSAVNLVEIKTEATDMKTIRKDRIFVFLPHANRDAYNGISNPSVFT